MPIKKSELYSSIWQSCDELRGGMDASQYKDYVLVLLFVKYVSDKAASQKNYLLDVPKGGSFADMIALKGDKEIGDKMNKIVAKLAEANDLKGVIDVADWNDEDKLGKGKDMVDRLSNLIGIFDKPELDFRANRADGDDLLGDAYEYLMRHFATESGKSKGQFYTPAEVSRIMAKVIGLGSAKNQNQTIYDPTCGSGSLLLKAHDEAMSATGLNLAVYGQENDNATAALARMNLILHDVPTGEIWKDNTLSSPHFKEPKTGTLKTFDFGVANPPFSTKAWSNGLDPANDLYARFALGIPPTKNGDYAFLLHLLASLKSAGKGAIILPHGVLFRGNTEADIRREIVRRGYIKGIIGLPPNLFFGTGIPACIIVLDKEGASARKGIFMIDASKGFVKDGPKNRLRAQDIHKIVDAFTRQLEVLRFSRMVPLAEISDAKNNFNLNLPRYIDSSEPEDLQDIEGHLRGGVPERDLDALSGYWKVLPSVRAALFESAGRPGYARLKLPIAEVKAAIFAHAEFVAFNAAARERFRAWQTFATPQFLAFSQGGRPKVLIETIAEALLDHYKNVPLIDTYDIYQHLMDYWVEAMQDDCYLIAEDGWVARTSRIVVSDKKGKQKDKGWACELVPKPLVVARYFAKEQAALDAAQAELDAATASLAQLEEEHGGEEGFLGSLDKIAKAEVSVRLKEIKGDKDAKDESAVLKRWLELSESEANLRRSVKELDAALDKLAYAKYLKLTKGEIKTLVVDDKWMARLSAEVQGELDRVSQTLTGRIRELAERYASPLPQLTDEVSTLAARVDAHLKNMGAVWR
jgi:type I restriction enzyme M protein